MSTPHVPYKNTFSIYIYLLRTGPTHEERDQRAAHEERESVRSRQRTVARLRVVDDHEELREISHR